MALKIKFISKELKYAVPEDIHQVPNNITNTTDGLSQLVNKLIFDTKIQTRSRSRRGPEKVQFEFIVNGGELLGSSELKDVAKTDGIELILLTFFEKRTSPQLVKKLLTKEQGLERLRCIKRNLKMCGIIE